MPTSLVRRRILSILFVPAQIFVAYTTKYGTPVQDWSDKSKDVSVQGRKAIPPTHVRQGPFLSWAGFEAVCQDFNIITAPSSSATDPSSTHLRPLAHHHPSHQYFVRDTPLGHHEPSKPSTPASASKPTRQPDPPVKVSLVGTPTRGLLSRVQASIVFMSACVHGPVVASFPAGGKDDSVFSGENAKRDRIARGGRSAGEKETMGHTEDDAAYWHVSFTILSGYSKRRK